MATTIATYYMEELDEWTYRISSCTEEIENLRAKLEDVIRRNSIKNIAEKVEIHLASLNKATAFFNNILDSINQQEKLLKTDSMLIDNTLIKDSIEKQQAVLRHNMQGVEKEFIDVKFNCHYFLSDIIKKR